MKKQKLVRDMDRILIRVPDGMRQRIEDRAKANRRSMTQEIVSMLVQVLENPAAMSINDLQSELSAIEREFHTRAGELEAIDRRKSELIDKIEKLRAQQDLSRSLPPE